MSSAKSSPIRAIRGMNDILPHDSARWLEVEATLNELLAHYGYQEIRTPIVESTQLFARSIGQDTDIVAKEMYTFEDRNGDSLTLRPEGTASSVRAGIEHGLLYNQQQRFWYRGPMFRHERPQKGRYRQFHQLGVECYGWGTADIEAEVIGLAAHIFARLGLRNTRLEINNLGDTESRARYREALRAYLSDHVDELDEDSVRRLATNPLRILDSKIPQTQAVVNDAPSLTEFLSEHSRQHLHDLQTYLDALGIAYQLNPKMVRGLDYYNDTVFEFICDEFGAQATVCGGGRYDGLVEQLGGQATPAFGFGLGLERLITLLDEQRGGRNTPQEKSVFIVSDTGAPRAQALMLRTELVNAGIKCVMAMGEGGLKNQFKKADKSGALAALIIGASENAHHTVNLKLLRVIAEPDLAAVRDTAKQISSKPLSELAQTGTQQITLAYDDVIDTVTNLLNSL